MKERNAAFDGKVEHRLENGVVTELSFSTEEVADLSPVRALNQLKKLSCIGPKAVLGTYRWT